MSKDRPFLVEAELPFRFCPGCTHGVVLEALADALVSLERPKEEIVAVSDIGCVGLADRYLACSTFHGLHGRSIAYAMGLKIARPKLAVVTLIGDGGVGIGAGHLLSAARRNVGICVLVFDNFNFGMTGGQHSVTTLSGAKTTTTPQGNIENPLDICELAKASGATFVARVSAFDKGLSQVLEKALSHPGFSLVDIWEVCSAHYMPRNDFRKKQLEAALAATESGILREERRPEYADLVHANMRSDGSFEQLLSAFAVEPTAGEKATEETCSVVVAGSAGMKIRYATSLLSRAAILSGSFAAQQDDFPITVLTGFSISEVVLAPDPVDHLEHEPADILLVLSDNGWGRFQRRGRRAKRVYRVSTVDSKIEGSVEIPVPRGIRKELLAIHGIAQLLKREPIVAPARYLEAIRAFGYRGKNDAELARQIEAAT